MSHSEKDETDQICEDTPSAQAAEASFQDVSTHLTILTTIRLGTLRGPFGDWRFDPVAQGALVVIVPDTMRKPIPWKLRRMAARANKEGLLMRLDPDNPASRQADTPLYLPVPERYRVYWTLDDERYEEALEEPPWLEAHSSVIQLKQHRASGKLLFKPLDELDEGDVFYQRQEARSVIRNHILERHTFYEDSGVPYQATYDRDAVPFFDVTPRPIRALFLVEVLQWYALRATARAAEDIATMQNVCVIAEAADKGLRNAKLDREVPELFPTDEDRRMFECYREYVWRCAATGVDPLHAKFSLQVTTGGTEQPPGGVPVTPDALHAAPVGEAWYTHATTVLAESETQKNGPAVHPYFRGFTGLLRGQVLEARPLTTAQQRLLLRYYEGYQFGAAMRVVHVDDAAAFKTNPAGRDQRTRMAARLEDWTRTGELLTQRCAAILKKHVGADLYQVWSECYRDDETLLSRYVTAAAHCEFAWWDEISKREGEATETEWPFWKTFKTRVKPSYEMSKGASKLCKLLSERVAGYKLAVQEANKMLGTVGRLELALRGGVIDPARHVVETEKAVMHLLPTPDGGEVRITLKPAARHGSPGMQRTVRLNLLQQVGSGGGAGPAYQFKANFTPKPMEVELPAHVDDMAQVAKFSSGWGVLAESVNIAIGMTIFFGEGAKGSDRFYASFDLLKGMVGIVKGFPSAITALLPQTKDWQPLKDFGKTADSLKKTSEVLAKWDSAFKAWKGLQLLLSDDPLVRYEREMNRPFRAQLQQCANVANIVVGFAGAVDVGATVAGAAGATEILGFSTAAYASFSLTGFGLFLSVGGALFAAGAALAIDLAQPWSEEYRNIEAAWASACKNQVRGTRFKVSSELAELLDIAGSARLD